MLADEEETSVQAGTLGANIHLPGEWLSSLVGFIAAALPGWRDDPKRPAQVGETGLTAQLCARLNSVSRHSTGWDFLQFRREEPDDARAGRSIDLVVAPSGALIWISGREYSEYRTLLPIECKRLPTPSGKDRDEREYVFSQFSSTGGIQRFKAGHHGAAHARAGMIGYVQGHDIPFWHAQLDAWIDGLVATAVQGWSADDKLVLAAHYGATRIASLQSTHKRDAGREPILIDHLWIEM
ncbi:hypothetical protein [Blastochloris sulfoviridis]|uniref:Uncharacterized protein n=1 Tax=Blastochloris sulfoviridis TaxID=50712 RepID=A0A5M6HTM1_9HYPH|nr:hypothetical protein [Blastochloris sulfoviridis]KAA5599216.1 hypothetical protein F1193_12335 [Blastochloris sulfoviridis]